jgi:hypothetical protein
MRTVCFKTPFYEVDDDPRKVIGDFLGYALSLKNISERAPAEEFADLFSPSGRGMGLPDVFVAYRAVEPDDVPSEFGEETAREAERKELWVLTRLQWGRAPDSAVVEGDELRHLLGEALEQHTAATLANALALLEDRGAAGIPHPGETLLAHLSRVRSTLESWGARPDLCMAGLCHAFYGTDGFDTRLGDLDRRYELSRVIGILAEKIVYLYGACDRRRTYPGLLSGEPVLADRFTGETVRLDPGGVRDFAELTVANELDVMEHSAELRERHAADLAAVFTTWKDLLSPAAAAAVEDFRVRAARERAAP